MSDDDDAKKADALASLTLPVTPMIPGLVRRPYRRVDAAAAVRASIERRRAKAR